MTTVPLAGKQLSYLDTARLAHKHGVPLGEKLAVCVAVCEWESRRRVGAWNFNPKTKDQSYGLWQINLIGKLKAERMAKYGLEKPEDLYDPDVNARVMVEISNKGENWKPWGAYTNGRYKRSLKDARKAVSQLTDEIRKKEAAAKKTVPPMKPAPKEAKKPVSTTPAWVNASEPAHDYTRTTHGGKTVNQRTKVMLQRAEKLYGKPIKLTQGSYNKGVAASAGTHDGGGVVDVSTYGLDSSGRFALAMALRKAGFFAWVRTPNQGFAYHIHAVAIGDRGLASLAKKQQTQGFQDRNGLANRGKDTAPDPHPKWIDKYGKHVSLDRPK
jgi:hypothetical protein